MKYAIALALALSATLAHAQAPDVVGLHLVSKHSNYDFAWNDTNPGVYARWDGGLTVGTYYNSNRKQSFYVGWTGEKQLTPRIAAGITLGGVTGYTTPLLPLVVPSVSVRVWDKVSLRTSFLYSPLKNGAHALHLSAEWKF